MKSKKIHGLEKTIGLKFNRKDLLSQALTHSSFAYENQQKGMVDNEVLEFLGDSVVGLAVADFFCSSHPNLAEGDLSKLKSTAASTLSLSEFAKQIKLDKYILLGKGEEKCGGRKKKTILAGTFEALVGAIYLDQGFEAAKEFLMKLLGSSFQKIKTDHFLINNYKSALQEHFQKENNEAPVYRTLTEKGPDHDKSFVVEVSVDGKPLAKAKGRSKKDAEQKAAQKALKGLLGRKIKSFTAETFMLKK